MSCDICSNNGIDKSTTFTNTPIEKSALAFLKIHKLIEVGYGGNVTNEEWDGETTYYAPQYDSADKEIKIYERVVSKSLIAFHTKEQVKEFLSHSENVQLLKDYFMI